MEKFLNAPVIWFIIGFLFFLLEFAVPGFILFFFGIGAWVVAGITFFSDISLNLQILIFLGTSLLTVLLFRNWLKNKLGMMNPPKKILEDEIIGKTAKAETPIQPGQQGKVYFKGASWSATSADTIHIGEEVSIIGYDSIVLIVKSSKLL
jgi:membrane protein implicated in regulation of membrane protease activity